jgi:hypothetical protein
MGRAVTFSMFLGVRNGRIPSPVEAYLQQHGPPSPLELESLTLTLRTLGVEAGEYPEK